MDSNKKFYSIACLFCILLFLPLIVNIKRAVFFDFNPHDFGILMQALIGISQKLELNPFASLLQVNIFNDHFDPGLVLASWPLFFISNKFIAGVFSEWFFYFLSCLIIIWGRFKISKDSSGLMYGFFLFVFSRILLQGIDFPIHPSTMSLFPLTVLTVLLFRFAQTQWSYLLVFIFSLLACTFREIIPFMLLSSSFYFLFNKKWKLFLAISFPALFWLCVYFCRQQLIGPTIDYGESTLSLVLANPIQGALLRSRQFFCVNS